MTEPAAPIESAAAAVAAPAAPPAHNITWLPADAAPDVIGHATNAGWKSPADAVQSHYELQKLFGADRHGRTVVVPKDDAPPEEWAKFHEKMGRPASAADYKLPVPEGGDPKFAEAASAWMFEAGVPAKAAQALTAKFNEHLASVAAQQAAEQEAALAAEHAALAKDWGTGPEAGMRRELAKRAAVSLGLDESAIDAMEKVAGFSKTMKALAKVGDLMRESGGEGMNELGSFGATPEGARAKRAQLMADAGWRKAAMNPASREWADLQKLDAVIAASMQ